MKKTLCFVGLLGIIWSFIAYSHTGFFIADAASFNVVSISPTIAEISPTAGEFTVIFNDYIDPNTLKDNIEIAFEDGTRIKGGSYPMLDGQLSKTVKIKYGKLQPLSTYKVVVRSGLRSTSQIPVTPYEKTFTTSSGYLMNENFMGAEYVVGMSPPTNKGIEYTSATDKGSVVNNASNMIVSGNDSFRYISMWGGGYLALNNRIQVLFSKPITNSILFLDVVARPATNDGGPNTSPRDFITMISGEGNEIRVATMRYDNVIKPYGAVADISEVSGSVSFSTQHKDGNGFFCTRTIFQKNQAGNYYATFINLKDTSKQLIVRPLKAAQSLKGVRIAHLYPFASMSEALYDRAEISEIKIWEESQPGLLCSNLDSLTQEDDTLQLVFNDDMDAMSFSASNISLFNESNKRVPIELMNYEENTRTVSIKLKEYLEYGKSYTLSINGVASSNGLMMQSNAFSFQMKPYELAQSNAVFKGNDGSVITSLKDQTNVTTSIALANSTRAEKTVAVFLVLTDANGRVINIISKQSSVPANGSTTVDIMCNQQVFENGYVLKAYVWDLVRDDFLAVSLKPAQISY